MMIYEPTMDTKLMGVKTAAYLIRHRRRDLVNLMGVEWPSPEEFEFIMERWCDIDETTLLYFVVMAPSLLIIGETLRACYRAVCKGFKSCSV